MRCLPRWTLVLLLALTAPLQAAEPTKVKAFVGAMFEIGKNTGDRAGEFQDRVNGLTVTLDKRPGSRAA